MTNRQWTEEQKREASERMKAKNESKKKSEVNSRIRVPVGANRDVTAVRTTPDGYIDRWVNDEPGRINLLKKAGYELVESAQVGDEGVDGTHSESGVVSRDMGKGVIAYLMRQRNEYYEEDQTEKQKIIDENEEIIRRNKNDEKNDGRYGEVKIGRN